MKTLFTLIVIAAIGWFIWNKYIGGPPRTFENPVYADMRATVNVQGREIEMAITLCAALQRRADSIYLPERHRRENG